MDTRLEATPFDTVTVTSIRYHTTGDNHDVEHVEGAEYQVSDGDLMRTLVACQFADFKAVVVAATGATAGTPGSFTPAGATPPANLAAMSGIVATPATAWTTGQHVVLGDASHAHWSGTAWVAGDAP